jgi:phosphoenolpyruvate synthase/pyruvate phosphate dikinase
VWVVDFADGSADMRDLLGGKGANLAEMTRILGLGVVPSGFTITTAACVAYIDSGGTLPDELEEQVLGALGRLEDRAGRRLGDSADPLLVSVRSGARESMPGMLDTVLGVCGEHGGDPASIEFFHRSGIDYVSCSAFRVPVARVAAAQAAVRAGSA